MKTTEELQLYKSKIEQMFGACQKLKADRNIVLKNANGTSDSKAYDGWTWIEYWRAMTGNTSTRLTCCSCGESIYVGEVPKVVLDLYRSTGDNPDNHRAFGGHLWINEPQNKKYQGGLYIAPICPICNNLRGQGIPVLKGSIICKALGTHKVDNK